MTYDSPRISGKQHAGSFTLPAHRMAPQRGFEPPTYRLGGGRSILLSYWGREQYLPMHMDRCYNSTSDMRIASRIYCRPASIRSAALSNDLCQHADCNFRRRFRVYGKADGTFDRKELVHGDAFLI